jgi:replicative DNA helicase
VTQLFSLADSVRETEKLFRTFDDGEMPELVPTGIKAIDSVIGGVGEGTFGCVGAGPGVGKSSIVLSALDCLQKQGVKGGYQSNEDGPDVVGSRVLARYSGVNSLAIRKKSFTEDEYNDLLDARVRLDKMAAKESSFLTSYAVSGSLTQTVEGVHALGEAGCKIIYMDYLQKIHGRSGDRRYDIGQCLNELHGAAAKHGASLIMLSQISRQANPGKMPGRFALKESGDIENEARMILMLCKDGNDGVLGNLDKSSFGGEGTKCAWERRSCGPLWETEYEDNDEI